MKLAVGELRVVQAAEMFDGELLGFFTQDPIFQ